MNAKQQAQAAKALKSLLDFYGGQCAQLARAMDVSQAVVRKWKSRGYMSLDGAIRAESRIGSPAVANKLRPDLPPMLNS